MASDDVVHVEVVYCPQPSQIDCVALELPVGATLADALLASGLIQRHALPAEDLRLGIWSKPREPNTLLREGDRVEVYRSLKVDPKEARRQRYQQHKDSVKARAKP